MIQILKTLNRLYGLAILGRCLYDFVVGGPNDIIGVWFYAFHTLAFAVMWFVVNFAAFFQEAVRRTEERTKESMSRPPYNPPNPTDVN